MRDLTNGQYSAWIDAGRPTAFEQWPRLLAARALLTEIRADAERGAAELDVIAEINKVLGDRG